MSVALAPRSASSISSTQTALGSTSGRMPFLKQLLKKMSANDGAITQRMPKSRSAHGACSRLEPQPKFSKATRISACRHAGRLSTKSGRSLPSALKRISANKCLPSPLRSVTFR